MNAYGELGPTNPAVAAEVRHHQRAFRKLVTGIVTEAGYTNEVANAIYLLVEGSVATAAVQHTAAQPARLVAGRRYCWRATGLLLAERRTR